MGLKPAHTYCIAWTVQRPNHSATLSAQSSFVCYLNRTNKTLKQRCSASDRKIIRSEQKNVSNQANVQSKPDLKLGIWNVLMK